MRYTRLRDSGRAGLKIEVLRRAVEDLEMAGHLAHVPDVDLTLLWEAGVGLGFVADAIKVRRRLHGMAKCASGEHVPHVLNRHLAK